ncbi:MAG: 4Fe-4S binding protein, partial [Syntrophaceae bacterium]|nr:4Fe-4S binding protein [Syntrophaceae bacterium]
MELIRIDEEKCTSCGLCIPLCVRGILEEGERAARVTNPDGCTLCGHCKAVCPVDAPALVVLHINPSESTSPMIDAGLAGMQMVLMVESLNLGTCFCGFFVFAVNMSLEFK